jgi:hypothetical protein
MTECAVDVVSEEKTEPPISPSKSGSGSSTTSRTSSASTPADETTKSTITAQPKEQQQDVQQDVQQEPKINKMPSPKLTPVKLRRKVSVEESIDNAVSVQRLVEYFTVVSCHPRWETAAATSNKVDQSQAPRTPIQKRPQAVSANHQKQTSTSSNGSNTRHDNDKYNEEGVSPKRIGRSINDVVDNDEKTGTDHAINHTLSPKNHNYEDDDESKEEEEEEEDPSSSSSPTLLSPPPTPREKWNRNIVEEKEEESENIHMPDTSIYSGDKNPYTFAPKITARFPLEDHSDHPLNPMVTQFCFPVGDIIQPSEYRMPSAHHFVMTNDKGRKIYGTCLTIYEEYQPTDNTPWQNNEKLHSATVGEAGIEVSVNSEGKRFYIPKCLCILSIWPYVTAFREYLAQLYRLATSTDCMKAPIERYVMNLCMEIPAPPPGSFEVKISILDSVIRFWSPPAKLPIAYVALPYQILFDCLDIENILHLWYCLTMERKIILVSSQHSILTVCSEILCSLLYPMKWSHLYVPLLPKFLCPILDAPGT